MAKKMAEIKYDARMTPAFMKAAKLCAEGVQVVIDLPDLGKFELKPYTDHLVVRDDQGRRQCMWINQADTPTERGYIPCVVTEGVAGFRRMSGLRSDEEPWWWGPTLERAQQTAASWNKSHGLSEEETNKIILSSMAAGRPNSRKVVIEVTDGVADVTECPDDVECEIIDHDEPGEFDSEDHDGTCDECNESAPLGQTSLQGPWHKPSCSLYKAEAES